MKKIDLVGLLKGVGKFYRYFATTLLTVLMLFILLNLICYGAIKIKKAYFPLIQFRFSAQDRNVFEALYPGLKSSEIRELWKELIVTMPFIYDPYTQSRMKPRREKYTNVHESGFRYSKNQASWPPATDHFNIFIFGGSTTFGWGVPDDQTIASYLQDSLRSEKFGERVSIYNFGQCAFFSTQERIFFEQLLATGYRPNMAIFIDGANECALDEPLHAKSLRLLFAGKISPLFPQLPVTRVVSKIIDHFVPQPVSTKEENRTRAFQAIINRYRANKKLIEVIANGYHIQPVFVWQPVPLYKYALKYDVKVIKERSFIYEKDSYAYMEEAFKRGELGGNFLWLADIQENQKKLLYVDHIHYSPEMSQIIASYIYAFIKDNVKKSAEHLDRPMSSESSQAANNS